MNLMEIGKEPEIQKIDISEETKNLPDIIDKWKLLVLEQAKALEMVTAERDALKIRCQDMEEFLLKLQEKMYSQRIEKQKLIFENHELQGEIEHQNSEANSGIVQKGKNGKRNRKRSEPER